MRRASALLRAAWLLVATLAAVWACSAVRLLRRDASEPNFADLPAEDKMALLSREVVLMHHKRLQELNNTLTRLARLEGADELHVTVVQTLGASEAAAADASAALLRALAPGLPFNLSHRPLVLPPSAADGTYSVDSSRYGTKRNSFRNLLHGLEGAFTAEPRLRSAIVLEDDAVLAVDAGPKPNPAPSPGPSPSPGALTPTVRITLPRWTRSISSTWQRRCSSRSPACRSRRGRCSPPPSASCERRTKTTAGGGTTGRARSRAGRATTGAARCRRRPSRPSPGSPRARCTRLGRGLGRHAPGVRG